jgi:hypothetical protein
MYIGDDLVDKVKDQIAKHSPASARAHPFAVRSCHARDHQTALARQCPRPWGPTTRHSQK